MIWPDFSVKASLIPLLEINFKLNSNNLLRVYSQLMSFSAEELFNLAKIMRAMQRHYNASVDIDVTDWLIGKLRESGIETSMKERVVITPDFSWILKLGDCLD